MRAAALGLALSAASVASPSWAQTTPAAGWGRPSPTTPGPWPTAQPAPGAGPFNQGTAPGAPGATTGFSETTRQLNEAEREDSGRGLEWFWVQAEGGVHYVGLEAIDGRGLLLDGQKKGEGAAPIVGFALGGRLVFFTVGAHARVAFLPVGQLGTLNLEGGYHIPLGNFEPYVQLGAGYARLFGADRPAIATQTPTVQGFDVRLGGGFDYYLAPQFSLGLLANVELLWLFRPAVGVVAEGDDEPASRQRARAEASRDGSSVGVATGLTVVAGLHF